MKKLLSLIILIAVLSFSVYSQTYELHTSNKQPTLIIPFLEESLIESYIFTDSGLNPVQMTYSTEDNYTYEFNTQEILELGMYILTINPTDVLGNPAPQSVVINLFVEPVTITLINPPLEVSPTETFDVVVETSEEADCRYSDLFRPEAFEDLTDNMEKIPDTNRHKIVGFTAPVYPANKPLWVLCKDAFGYDTDVYVFELSVDMTPPKIISAVADPSKVIEYRDGEKKTTLRVETDDPTVCKYSTISSNYDEMNLDEDDDLIDGFFAGNDELNAASYLVGNNKELTGLANPEQYKYFVSCKNLAQLVTEQPAEINFEVNLSAEFGIISTYPEDGGYIGATDYTINVSTNKEAKCNYDKLAVDPRTSPELISLGKIGEYYWYTAPGTGDEGKNKIILYCKPIGSPEIREINFVIDTTPPLGIDIQTDNVTWITDELNAKFIFEDNESPIDYYNYTIKDQFNKVVVEDVMTRDPEVKVDRDQEGEKLNLSDKTTYTWYVTATNKAGHESTEKTGTIMIDISTKPKDIYPPVVMISTVLGSRGTNITLSCSDPKRPSSGCNPSQLFYGTSDTTTCFSSKLYNETFVITKAQLVCYKFFDRANNMAENTTFVNVSPRLDIDGDSVFDNFDQCLDTPEGEQVDEDGCSCSQLDDDLDGVNNCNDRCPDTPITETALSDGCSESQRDTDGDGIPDQWEDQNGLDKLDPNDARQDPDRDGLNNLEEYQQETDPNNPDTDGDGFYDGGEIVSGTDPLDPDSHPPDEDGDFIDDNWESANELDPTDPNDAYQDPDSDGLSNFMEYNYGTDPGNSDSDGDGILDGGEVTSETDPNDTQDKPEDKDGDGIDDRWELVNGLDPTDPADAELDPDGDTLTNYLEYLYGSNPNNKDGDGDGMPDNWEIKYDLNVNFNDAEEDPDEDGFTNYEEYKGGTNPRDPRSVPRDLDSDGDGIPDIWEKAKGLDHLDATDAELDQDNDGLLAIEEYSFFECLEPFEFDTDADGYDDNTEIQKGTNPCDPTDTPPSYLWLWILLIILLVLGVGGYFGYKYAYPAIVKKLGKPTLRKWPPFERVVGRPELARPPVRKVEKKKEKPKPKTTREKLAELAKKEELFEKLGEVTKKKPAAKKAVKVPGKKIEKPKPKTAEKLEKLGATGFEKLGKISKKKPKKLEKPAAEKKKPTKFDMLDKIGKAKTKEEVFKALPGKKEDVFTELKKTVGVKETHLEKLTRVTAKKDVDELVKTFEKLKVEEGARASLNVFKTILGHLMKAKKINIKDVEEVLLKLKEESIFTDKQVSDVLFSLKS